MKQVEDVIKDLLLMSPDDLRYIERKLVEQQMLQQNKLIKSNMSVIKSYIKSVIQDVMKIYPDCRIKCRYIKSIDTYEFYYSNKKYINNTEFEDLFYSVSETHLYDNEIKNYCFNYR